MSSYAKILSLSYNSAVATKTVAHKSKFRSLRLIKESGAVNPGADSTVTNVLLNGKCVDPETRNLYVFYIDTYFGASWIIEINLDTRVQTVVYYDKLNNIGFDPLYKIHNPRVVQGRIIWTDNKNSIYQMDIARAKKSFALKIGYGQYPNTVEWDETTSFGIDQIVSNGKYYYKSLIDNNTGNEPRADDGTKWEDLKCLIEDAYYSMNVENFYFAPAPPKYPPTIEYVSLDSRKINNLRQTLFQFAYRYVYMDWRKSTFSPASTVPLPQAEEDVINGFINSQVSLNNTLRITVNLGGEEVREIEIVARSSDDPSQWYLVETVEKFSTQERNDEVSRMVELETTILGLSPLSPTAINDAGLDISQVGETITALAPTVVNSYISSESIEFIFNYNYSGVAAADSGIITAKPSLCYLSSKPAWLTVADLDQVPILIGQAISDGDTILIYPNEDNAGPELSGYITLTNDYGDECLIRVIQLMQE